MPQAAKRRLARQSLTAQTARTCRFETMEERRLLDADPIQIGVTYFEEDGGSDLHGDTFEILFEGGAAGTELTQLTIDGDHNAAGLSFGDMLFDTVKGGLGADEAFPLQVISSTGINNVSWQVGDGGTTLTFQFTGFHAGEKLIFSIDVDEVQEFDPNQTNQAIINEGIDPIASGVEFQGSQLSANFSAPHYHNASGNGEFRNQYDPLFTGSQLLVTQGNANGLPNDNFEGKRDRSTGTMLQVQQTPLPITIAGRVFADNNRNLVQDGSDFGLSTVTLGLFKKVNGQFVSTGHTTTTNSQGDYKFGAELNLLPGIYQVRETQPAGYYSVGAIPGTVAGTATGATVPGDKDILTEINIPLGGQDGIRYDFAEAQPGSLSGRVDLVTGANDCDDENAVLTPLAGVKLTLKNAAGVIVGTTFTDENGEYEFTNLEPGTYTITEETPVGLIDGSEHVGTINGIPVGNIPTSDIVTNINLDGGQNGIRYDFCELLPVSIAGHVFVDRDGDCTFDTGETPIANVPIELLNQQGIVISTTFTNAQGEYKFDNLPPGVYTVHEIQPAGYIDGGEEVGSHGGDESVDDVISNVSLVSGDDAINYDFCEKLPVSIAGKVFADTDGDCEVDPGEVGIGGVTIELLNELGIVIATTLTDANGNYKFDQLPPGIYTVHEFQPDGYFDGGEEAGSHGGDESVDDVVSNVDLESGDNATEYNFCEKPPAQISGFVFRDGPPILTTNNQVPANLYQLRDGVLTPDDLRLGGVLLELRHTLTGEPVLGEELLSGTYPPGPVRTTTNAAGYYEFTGLPQGNYSVFEAQPVAFFDSQDTPGSTGGLAVNLNVTVSPLVLQRFAAAGVSLNNDAILQVPLSYGQHSQLNNFSEVQVRKLPPPPEEEPPPEEPPPPQFFPFQPLPPPPPELFIPPPQPPDIITGGGGGFTWHLSVIDAGLPRVARRSTRQDGLAFRPALWVEKTEWQPERLKQGVWYVHGAQVGNPTGQLAAPHALFGLPGATPVVGDFNGDGKDEIGVYFEGEWFLDLNGNGQWDSEDLWAKLGSKQDRPVTGDWDGDGKEDIGIFGPRWPGDPVHLENEPGLPDQDNQRIIKLKPKNVPLNPEEATDGERLLRLTSQGKERADLIDHVFEFGGASDIPIAGDWNGDGIRSIGTFRGGKWHFDMDGDGRWSEGDKTTRFGDTGDLPVVGDFNGDGIEEIAIFRSGKWIIDSNGNRQIDATDQVVELGEAGDLPIAGDFDGDGIDEPAIYRPTGS